MQDLQEPIMKQEADRLWTICDVAEYCQVKESVVKYWIYNANLPYIKLGKHIRFQEMDVKGWIEGMKSSNIVGNIMLRDLC